MFTHTNEFEKLARICVLLVSVRCDVVQQICTNTLAIGVALYCGNDCVCMYVEWLVMRVHTLLFNLMTCMKYDYEFSYVWIFKLTLVCTIAKIHDYNVINVNISRVIKLYSNNDVLWSQCTIGTVCYKYTLKNSLFWNFPFAGNAVKSLRNQWDLFNLIGEHFA